MPISKMCAALLAAVSLCWGAPPQAKNLILVTADGLRWQELFQGIDPVLMNEKAAGMGGEAGSAARQRLWRETPEARRAVLMPFFWKTLAPTGVVLGNPDRHSNLKVTNAYRISYPGYAEILTGRAQDSAIRGNQPVQNPTETVLEFLRRKLELPAGQVALFGSWNMFPMIGASRPGSILINAGRMRLGGRAATPRLRELDDLQFEMLMPDESMRHDYVTFGMALEYLKTAHPRVLHIAVGETDDWGHAKNYPNYLEMAAAFDGYLRQLWEFVQGSPEYRGNTLIAVASDHGRGSTVEDWGSHGSDVKGAERIWAAFFGPGVPAAGEAANTPDAFQRDIAPTILDLLGIDYKEYKGVAGKPIRF